MKKFAFQLCLVFGKALYWILKKLPKRNQITLITRRSNQTSEDFSYLSERISQRTEGSTVKILNHKISKVWKYPFSMLTEMRQIARSRAVIVDSYIPVVSLFQHRKNLPIIQIWHAIGAIKHFGYQSLDTSEGSSREAAELFRMHKNYSAVVASSARTAEIFAEGFGVSQQEILRIGSPRIDYLRDEAIWNKNREMLSQKLRLDPEKKTLLYLPTFRKSSEIPVKRFMESVDSNIWQVVYSPHPLDSFETQSSVGEESLILAEGFEAQQLLAIADAVVTDYSAVAYETILRKIPIVFWWYDETDYQNKRGLNVRQETLKNSNVLANSEAELKKCLNELSTSPTQNYSEDFLREFAVDAEKSVEKLLDYIYQ